MKIKADELALGTFLSSNEYYYEVPVYQRGYSWGISQWDDLWDDFESLAMDEIHFLGSIVLINKTANQADYNISQVVDGQQRLVTLSIIINVFKNLIKDKDPSNYNDTEYWKEIENNYLYTKRPGFDRKLKIVLGNIDKSCYEYLLNEKIDKIANRNIKDCYNYYLNKLLNFDFDNLKSNFNKLINNFKIVIIITDSEKTAFRLFETLNDRGLELSSIDLIKNKVLSMSSNENKPAGNYFDSIADLWDQIIRNLEDVDKTRFFRQYLMSSKILSLRSKVTKERLYDEFIKIINKVKIHEYLEDMQTQSLIYYNIDNASINDFTKDYNQAINDKLKNLKAIKATTSYTLLLRAFSEYKDDPKAIIDLIHLIEVFAIRRIITDKSTNELDNIYNKLAITAFDKKAHKKEPNEYIKKEFKSNIPDDDEFVKYFTLRSFRINDQLKYILDTIEERGYSSGGGKRVYDRYSVHIEHIMPQTWKVKALASWKNYLDITESDHEKYKNRIGNLTLLEKRPNLKASNRPFDEKLKFYNKESTDFNMTHSICNYTSWNIEQIEMRGKELAQYAVKIWAI